MSELDPVTILAFFYIVSIIVFAYISVYAIVSMFMVSRMTPIILTIIGIVIYL